MRNVRYQSHYQEVGPTALMSKLETDNLERPMLDQVPETALFPPDPLDLRPKIGDEFGLVPVEETFENVDEIESDLLPILLLSLLQPVHVLQDSSHSLMVQRVFSAYESMLVGLFILSNCPLNIPCTFQLYILFSDLEFMVS